VNRESEGTGLNEPKEWKETFNIFLYQHLMESINFLESINKKVNFLIENSKKKKIFFLQISKVWLYIHFNIGFF